MVGKDLLGFRCREDEFYVGGRFFEGFEQCVERRRREHVNLIDVVDLELSGGGRKSNRFAKFADLFHPVIGGAVDFENVEADPFGDLEADRIIRIKVHLGTAGAIESLGQDPGGRSFSGTAGTNKQIGMGEAILRDGIFQGLDDVVLPEHIVKCPRSIFSGKYLV